MNRVNNDMESSNGMSYYQGWRNCMNNSTLFNTTLERLDYAGERKLTFRIYNTEMTNTLKALHGMPVVVVRDQQVHRRSVARSNVC
jgi:hypothetical protein